MIIIWGSGLYGKVDEVPGLGHVATRFGHLWYIPLIPMGSVLVVGKSGDSYQGVSLGLNLKSVFMAWLRAAALIGGIVFLFVALLARGESAPVLMPAVTCASCWSLLIFTKLPFVQQASYKKAMKLARELGLPQEACEELRAYYQMTSKRRSAR